MLDTNNPLRCTVALAMLQQVTDPEIGLNIVDLGLLYSIHFDEAGQKISVVMTTTTRFCPMGETIVQATRRCLEQGFPGYEIAIDLRHDPPWSSDRISAEGKAFLEHEHR